MSEGIVAIGFDPGLAITGYGVVCAVNGGLEIVAGGVICTDKGAPRPQRLQEIYSEARTLIETHRPEGIAIEEVFLATNAKTAMRTAEARGALLLASAGRAVRGYTPLQVKKRVTGYGKAPKSQVQAMVKRLLGLAEIPKPDDMADGLALALCYLLENRGVRPTNDVYL
jgi:crossover junction endodeoxyribonuclease RuvC